MNDCNPIPCNCKDGKIGIQGLKGPKGDEGAIGSVGLQGPVGLTGPQGLQGPDGVIGIQGVTGTNGASVIVGPAGPQGPQGPLGLQGPDGTDGTDGLPGTAGADDCAAQYQVITGNCSYNEIGFPLQQFPCSVYNLGPTDCPWTIMNKRTGSGVIHFTIGNPRVLNDRISFMGFDGMAKWRVAFYGGKIEMAAYNSTTANITTLFASGSPYFGSGAGVITFAGGNTGDYIELIYIGDNHFLIVECNLANEQLPLFT